MAEKIGIFCGLTFLHEFEGTFERADGFIERDFGRDAGGLESKVLDEINREAVVGLVNLFGKFVPEKTELEGVVEARLLAFHEIGLLIELIKISNFQMR